ncbi:MAG TPA: DUF4142 domain-containing protein [Tepidisphaeraceae bacterium]|nr:DUF4142 domain-containing protein [Tepidisphaeraceae bacterium]
MAVAVASLIGANVVLADKEDAQNNKTPLAGTAAQERREAEQGQQADQSALQQVKQWAQDPQTACDKLFLLHAAVDSMWEVQLSQQAEQKSQDPKIKALAQRLIQDHQQLNQKLEQVAQRLNVRVPQSLPAMKQEELQIFAALPAQEYDKAYINQLHIGHHMDVAAFHGASETAKNEQVKEFAAANLPTLKEHLQMVKQEAVALGLASDADEAQPAGAHIPANGAQNANSNTPTEQTPKAGGGNTTPNR